jgi:hypothetical protein
MIAKKSQSVRQGEDTSAMQKSFNKSLQLLAFAISAIATSNLSAIGPARAESPFHTGVWQVNTPNGPVGLVVSDWLIYDNGLPSRWIYTKAGANDINQFDFTSRSVGRPDLNEVDVQVYRTGPNSMRFTRFEKGRPPIENSAIRLSQPNYSNSCLSVENLKERQFGTTWIGTRRSSVKSVKLDPGSLTIDGKTMSVNVRRERVGRLAIIKDGRPLAFFTLAGGDYAVLQWFKAGVTVAQVADPQYEIMDFQSEDIVRDPKGTCDRQIASRLKLLGKK